MQVKRNLIYLLLGCWLLVGSLARAQVIAGSITMSGADCTVATRCVALGLSNTPYLSTATVAATVGSGFTGTLQFEASANSGVTWAPVVVNGSGATSTTLPGVFVFSVPAFTNFRVRASALAVAPALINLQASQAVSTSMTGAAGVAVTAAQGAAGPAAWPVSLSTLPALTAGAAIVGKVTTDQTTHGTSDLVAADVTKVAGGTIAQGHGVAATAIRVELPTDGTGVVSIAGPLGQKTMAASIPVALASDTNNTLTTVAYPFNASGAALSAVGLSTVTVSQSVKNASATLFGIAYQNGAAGVCWVQCVNSAGAGTLGTAAVFSIPMGASATGWVGFSPFALASFSTGIACGISTTNNGASACGTAGNLTIFYK